MYIFHVFHIRTPLKRYSVHITSYVAVAESNANINAKVKKREQRSDEEEEICHQNAAFKIYSIRYLFAFSKWMCLCVFLSSCFTQHCVHSLNGLALCNVRVADSLFAIFIFVPLRSSSLQFIHSFRACVCEWVRNSFFSHFHPVHAIFHTATATGKKSQRINALNLFRSELFRIVS